MGKVTGFIEWQRLAPKKRPVAERVRDWREVWPRLSVTCRT